MNDKNINNYKMLCFIPKRLDFLVTTKTISYKGYTLKTAYIAHMINELISKYFLTGDFNFTIWSKILQELYGKYYARYMEYLIDNNIIILMSNKQVGKTSRRYRLNLNYIKGEKIIRPPFYDMFLYRKTKELKVDTSFTSLTSSGIYELVRKKLVADLDTITLDYTSAINYLCSVKKNITSESYSKNMLSLSHIDTNDIYYKFDSYGRMHTNFTTLKRHIRKNCIKIDGEITDEVDIKNSQPFFLGLLMKKEYTDKEIPTGLSEYISLVFNHLFYEDFQEKANINQNDREKAKDMIYKVLFGKNNNTKENLIFKSIYPDVFNFIITYKKHNGGYKSISHILQNMESEFIFNKVVNELMFIYPHIHIFTVHDSIVYPAKYKREVESVFYKYLEGLKL